MFICMVKPVSPSRPNYAGFIAARKRCLDERSRTPALRGFRYGPSRRWKSGIVDEILIVMIIVLSGMNV